MGNPISPLSFAGNIACCLIVWASVPLLASDERGERAVINRVQDNSTLDSQEDTEFRSRPTLAERLEDWGKIYSSEDNPVLQEFWLLGRYHGQYYDADSKVGTDDAWENRRFRIGSQAKLYENLTLHAQMVSGFDMEPFYNGFTELWSQWAFDETIAFTIGQQKHRFTHDRNVSSRYLNTLERSMLVNMFAADYTPAVTISGKTDKFSYYSGIFSNATGPDVLEALTHFHSGYSLLGSITFDVGQAFDSDSAHWNTCYLFSDSNQNATNLNRFEEGLSTALILIKGSGSLVTEGLIGLGGRNGEAYGINFQPAYFLTSKIQVATRYQLALSNEEQGLVAQRRYEQPAGLATGDLYQAGYAGLNYYVAGHRIKLMQGIEYADLNGQHVWTASIALRIFWGPNSNGPFPIAQTLEGLF